MLHTSSVLMIPGLLQAFGQSGKALPELCQTARRAVGLQVPDLTPDRAPTLGKDGADAAQQAQIQAVEALLLLAQATGRRRTLQPSANAAEMLMLGLQTSAHAALDPL